MIKNFGKLKQWTGERLGQAKATNQTEDFQQMEHDTDAKKAGFDKVFEAADAFQHHLAKKKPSPEDGKTKCPPLEALANCWLQYAATFSDDAVLGATMINVAHGELQISHLHDEYAASMRDQYVNLLQHGVHAYKDYGTLKKKLESRRLDYDAKLARLQKSKKEKPEWEQEMQAAKMKYEETEYDLIQKMVALQEYEADQCQALQQFVDAQLTYHQQSLEVLQQVSQQLGSNGGAPSGLGATNGYRVGAGPRPITRSSTLSSQSSNEDTPPARYRPMANGNGTAAGRQPSVDSLHQHHPKVVRAGSFSSAVMDDAASVNSASSRVAPSTPPIRRRSSAGLVRKQQKAVYDFQGETADELSFQVGDVITVIDTVDEGWWIGEMDALGTKKRGIFPVVYTAPMAPTAAAPPMPATRPVLTSNSSSTTTMTNTGNGYPVIATYIQEEPHDMDDDPYASADSPFTDRAAPPTSAAAPPSFNYLRGTTTPPASAVNSPAATRRTAPAPPIARSNTARSYSSSTRTPPPPPPSRGASTNATMAAVGPCHDCGCDDFTANVFKKGQCNNCFHKHE
ncbi:hypothetical protein BC940DRAFT_313711 [Gongronella butleri]|nr:hypothetical protein BC940DRAFT_313711 [Gongronella butleri]